MKPTLGLRVSQHLALTPQLQQSIRLLQLSTLELSQEIEQMLQDNPFLEAAAEELSHEEQIQIDRSSQLSDEDDFSNAPLLGASPAHSTSENDRFDLENQAFEAENLPESLPSDWSGDSATEVYADEAEWGSDAPLHESASAAASQLNVSNSSESDDFDPFSKQGERLTLYAHLHQQALGLRLSPEDRAALAVLIESLNEDGYLEDDFESLALSLGASTLEDVEELIQRFGLALKWLQQMEPAGVGARDLAECLKLQINRLPANEINPVALQILQQPLDFLARRDVRKLTQLCSSSVDYIKAAMALITRLEPKPGRAFADVERNIIIPDVIVTERKQRGASVFVAQLNAEVMPKLAVNEMYAGALKAYKKDESAQGLQSRLQEARWFIKNVQQRFDTILRVSQAIVERQKSFFQHGAVAMRPLVLREIADEIGMHESTISRITTAKYMSTPWGTFELKYFFGSALTTDTGGNASSTAVRELIRQFIEAENKAKPLSDQNITDLLDKQGIECARRTVAKYREAMRIPVTSLRKTL